MGKYISKTFVINPGIDLNIPCPIIPQKRAKSKLDLSEKKIILTVGRLIKRKGQDMVIKALPLVLKKIPDVIYLVVGRGPYQTTLQNLTRRLNLQERVKFAGFIESRQLSLYYNACDVFACLIVI